MRRELGREKKVPQSVSCEISIWNDFGATCSNYGYDKSEIIREFVMWYIQIYASNYIKNKPIYRKIIPTKIKELEIKK